MKKLTAPFEHAYVCRNDYDQITRGRLTLISTFHKTPLQNYIHHVHGRIIWENRGQIVIWTIIPLSLQTEPPGHHAPQQFSEHVNVNLRGHVD